MERPSPEKLGDRWFASEERLSSGMIRELQRVRRRALARPFTVLFLAAVVASGLTYMVVSKQRAVEAEVVLALSEGTLAGDRAGVAALELREYVTSVLLSDKNLVEVIEKENLHRSRKVMGMPFAISELREQMEIDVWKNTFVYYRDSESNARKSARIGITVIDSDPDQASETAHALAAIMIRTHDAERGKLTGALSAQVALMRETLEAELATLTGAISAKQTAMLLARNDGKQGLAAALSVDLVDLDVRHKNLEERLSAIATSRDAIADQISAAGLDVTLEIVAETRPDRPDMSTFTLVLLTVVLTCGALFGSAMVVSTFDPRVHDGDDVERLGLPVLGHVPAFAGDRIGSLRQRGRRASSRGARGWHSHR